MTSFVPYYNIYCPSIESMLNLHTNINFSRNWLTTISCFFQRLVSLQSCPNAISFQNITRVCGSSFFDCHSPLNIKKYFRIIVWFLCCVCGGEAAEVQLSNLLILIRTVKNSSSFLSSFLSIDFFLDLYWFIHYYSSRKCRLNMIWYVR
jgi:hypothetical protein